MLGESCLLAKEHPQLHIRPADSQVGVLPAGAVSWLSFCYAEYILFLCLGCLTQGPEDMWCAPQGCKEVVMYNRS